MALKLRQELSSSEHPRLRVEVGVGQLIAEQGQDYGSCELPANGGDYLDQDLQHPVVRDRRAGLGEVDGDQEDFGIPGEVQDLDELGLVGARVGGAVHPAIDVRLVALTPWGRPGIGGDDVFAPRCARTGSDP